MPLHWKRHVIAWAHVARQHARLASGLAMLRAVLSGPVPADVWRERMRVCLRCPILDRDTMACHKQYSPYHRVLGCRCYTPLLALTAAPYPRGCYARQITENEGWPSHQFASWRARVSAILRFFFP